MMLVRESRGIAPMWVLDVGSGGAGAVAARPSSHLHSSPKRGDAPRPSGADGGVMTENYDVIIVGTGAGGGTLAHTLAPSGKRILLLERGDFLPRQVDNWNPKPVFVTGKYISKDTWYDRDGKPFQPQILIAPGAIPRGLQHRDQERQPDRHRDEEEMVHGHEPELPPREVDVHLLPYSLRRVVAVPSWLGP